MSDTFAYFDSHSHVQLSEFDVDREEVIQRIEESNMGTVCVGVDQKTSREAVDLAIQNKNIFACVGQHPVDTIEVFDLAFYKDLLLQKKVVAIGECGLDYFRGADETEKERQRDLFIKHIDLSLETGKMLMLHVRPTKGSMDAYEDALTILEGYQKEHGARLKGNAHFFAGTADIAMRFVSIGFTISFSGVITFAREYDAVVRAVPLDMILSETDAPFAAPVPYRGRRNEPVYVSEVAKKIAEIRGDDPEVVLRAVVQNAQRVFGF